MFSAHKYHWDLQRTQQVGILLNVDVTVDDMKAITGSDFAPRRALRRMVDAEPEEAYTRVIDYLNEEGRLPEPVSDYEIEAARRGGLAIGIVGYVVHEPVEDMHRTILDRVFDRIVDNQGRHIAAYYTEDARSRKYPIGTDAYDPDTN